MGGWCVLIYGEGMLMRKGGGGVVCRQEVLCLYLRLNCENFHRAKSENAKSRREFTTHYQIKCGKSFGKLQQRTYTNTHRLSQTSTVGINSCFKCFAVCRDFCQKIDKQPKIEENSIEFNWQTYQFILTSFSLSIIAKCFHSLCRFSCFSIC